MLQQTTVRQHVTLDVESIRKDFPIFETQAHGKPLVYLDSAATSQKPRQVIDRMVRFYETENANVHRGVYELGERATGAYEGARAACARFIGARSPRSIIFTRGRPRPSTSCASRGREANVHEGDEILVTEMEHHSQPDPVADARCRRRGDAPAPAGRRRRAPAMDLLGEYITDRTKLVAVTLMSNVLGTINPVREIADAAHAVGARDLVDAAQAAPHISDRRQRARRATSSPTRRTRCAVRPEPACSTAGRICSRRCRRSMAAAR